MAERYDAFIEFVLNDGYNVERPGGRYWNKNLILSDQVAYNLFYGNEIDDLPVEYNWNPSKGKNDDAVIVHFYGLKWNQVEAFKKDKIDMPGFKTKQFKRMLQKSNGAYEYYREIANVLLGKAYFPANPDTV